MICAANMNVYCLIIYQQLNREPSDRNVFIVMSKDHRLIRLFNNDQHSYNLYKKCNEELWLRLTNCSKGISRCLTSNPYLKN